MGQAMLTGAAGGGVRGLEILEAAGDGAAVLHVTGNVNSSNAVELLDRLEAVVAAGRPGMALDLSRLAHITSAGMRALLLAERAAVKAGGTLVLYGLHGMTLELFEVGGFLEMFTVAGSREEALRLAAGPAKS